MIPDKVAAFREAYRKASVPAGYYGPAHFVFTSGVSLSVIGWALAHLRHVGWTEALAVPVTFLFANLVEYAGHKGPMRHPVSGLRLLYQRHTLEHHRFFTEEAMGLESTRDYKIVLFPPLLLVFFIGLHAVPVGIALYYLVSPDVAFLFVAVAIGYFLTYEWLHFSYHVPETSWVARIGFVRTLRVLHMHHHDPRLMTRYNFNITFPISDTLFGTRWKGYPEIEGHL